MSSKFDSALWKRKPSPLTARKDTKKSHNCSKHVKLSSKDKVFTINRTNNYSEMWTLGDSDKSEEEKYIVNRRAIEKLNKKRKVELQDKDKQIKDHEYMIKVMQATIRQYRTKVNKIRRLTGAAVKREECIFKLSNAKMEEANMNGDSDLVLLDSDPEDALEMNKVKYESNEGDDDNCN